MFVVPLIERKRDGGALTPEQWSALVAAYTDGRVPDYQMSALLMAVVLRGLERQELAALTDAMLASGQRLAFDSWSTPRVDKHSTGGVGQESNPSRWPDASIASVSAASSWRSSPRSTTAISRADI